MKKAAPIPVREGGCVVCNLYQELPCGAVFLGQDLKVLDANRKMRAYFPPPTDRPIPLTPCEVLRCPNFHSGIGGKSGFCEDCALMRGIREILQGGQPMREIKWKYAYCLGKRLQVRWFFVNGIPFSFLGQRYAVLFFHDITTQILKEKILRQRLKLDQQTKTLNKASLLRLLGDLLHTEACESFTVCMIDFDDFKNINDRYGHLMGDRVLDSFCRIARNNIRTGDALGRFGGDEFLLILKANQKQAISVLQRMQNDLCKSFAGAASLSVTFSAGVVPCGKKYRGCEELVKEADRLLYRAKEGGKNRIAQSARPKPDGCARPKRSPPGFCKSRRRKTAAGNRPVG